MTNQCSTPEGVVSSDGLGLLPERANLPPQIGRLLKPGMRFGQPVYSAEQMYAYAAREVAAERERCADLAESWPTPDCGGWTLQGLWEAIRKA